MVNVVNTLTKRQNYDAGAARTAKIIAVTSGKGGVGKTNVASNMAITLALQGARVCVFDADTSLANINIVMGLSAQYTIEHLLKGEKTIDEILLTGPAGIRIVPSASGISNCANLDEGQRQRLIAALTELEDQYDYLIIDTAAGLGHDVIDFVRSAQYIMLVITTEPTSLTDTFALIRTLKREGCNRPLYAVVSQARDYPDSWKTFARFQAAVKKFLKREIRYLGYIGSDEHLKEAISEQKPVVLYSPTTHASRCFKILASVVQKQFGHSEEDYRFSEYWRMLSIVKSTAIDSDINAKALNQIQPETVKEQLLNWVNNDSLTQAQATEDLQAVIEAYVKRFRSIPFAPQQLFSYLVDDAESSQDEAQHLLREIEARFVDRYQQPVNDLESTLAQLLMTLGMPTDIASSIKDRLQQAS